MKTLLSSLFCFLSTLAFAQKAAPYPVSDELMVSGLVNKPVTLSLSDMAAMSDTSFATIKIVTHAGQPKQTYQQAKCVSLKKLIATNLKSDVQQKAKNALYFVCRAADGFTLVFSNNEVLHSPNHFFIVVGYDGQPLGSMPERLELLDINPDFTATSRLSGLKQIEIRTANQK